MKLLNWYKKHKNKPVQLTIASIIISHTHAPLQLCIVAPQIVIITISVIAIAMQFVATIQSRSGAWVWLIIILAIVNCTSLFLYFLHQFSNFIQHVSVLFTPV